MKRRDFIAALGGVAASSACLPLAARAQQPASVRRIGVLMIHAEGDSEAQARLGAFRQRLSELGWFEGRNVHIDYRWSIAEATRAQSVAAELVADERVFDHCTLFTTCRCAGSASGSTISNRRPCCSEGIRPRA